jgi:hypothetical protein
MGPNDGRQSVATLSGLATSSRPPVAELLDRYDLSLTDFEIREAPCERREYETHRKKRNPLDDCIGAVAAAPGDGRTTLSD